MTHRLQLFTDFPQELQRGEETVNLGVERDSKVEIKDVIKTIGSVTHNSTRIRVPLLTDLAGIHAVIEGNRRRDVEILHDIERRLDGYRVHHTVTPVLDKAFVQEFVLLGCQ